MALTILYSDRIADLAADLAGKIKAEKTSGADPFKFTQVVVPNANIAKWLQMRMFAREKDLCAGIRFPFMEQRLTALMHVNLEHPEQFELLPDHAYAQAIMRILLTSTDDAFKDFRVYISGGQGDAPLKIETQKQARMAWQLADKLAGLMDQYEVRRPEIVENWLAGGSAKNVHTPPAGIEAAEAALAKALWGAGGVFPGDGNRLSLRQLYDRVKDTEPRVPVSGENKIYFFGQSTLTLLQARILVWLAKKYDVIFYHNNPCREYWGDIETARERRRALFGVTEKSGEVDPDKAFDWTQNDDTIENPLLTKFGLAGRETLRLLVDLEEELGEEQAFTWTPVSRMDAASEKPTVLSRVQESIRGRTSKVEKLPQDASIQVVGAPGIRREVEMVYNSILGSVYRPKGVEGNRPWPDCTFSDIAVLVPDMQAYRPVIESVFDARGEVPYGLIDTSASESSQCLAGFLSLMELKRKGLSRETLFAVLENPCVQAAQNFTREDVADWRELTEKLGAFDGFDRKNADDCFCWDWALSRLRLGRVADSLTMVGNPSEELPLVMAGGNEALKFSEIVELLYRELGAAFDTEDGTVRKLPCAEGASVRSAESQPLTWARVLGHLVHRFLAVPKDDQLEENVLRELLRTLNGLTGIATPQTFELPVAAVEHFVGGIACRKGGYLTHGVTIAGLQPMRPVPFKQVYVLGLGAGGFPGRTSSTTLDIRGEGWRLGDVSVPNTNRYLFLETLMSVQDRLVLSYPSRDIEKDAELFPSSLVLELESFIGKAVVNDVAADGKPAGFLEFKGYPLLEHGEARMDAEALKKSSVCEISWKDEDGGVKFVGILPTYSAKARKLARRRNGGCDDDPRSAREWEEAPLTMPPEYTAKELAEFIRSPMRAVLCYRYGVAVEGYLDRELEPDSPLGIADGPTLWDLQAAWLKHSTDGLEKAFRSLQLSGGAPMGFLGDFAKSKMEEALTAKANDIQSFIATFGDTEELGKAPTRSGRYRLGWGNGRQRDEKFYSVEQPGWLENEQTHEVSVLVSGFLGDENKISKFPPDRTLEPLMTFVIDLATREDQTPRSLRVGVVDLNKGTCRAWRWENLTPERAKGYLKIITHAYQNYLKSGTNGRPVGLEYRNVAGVPDLLEKCRTSGVPAGSAAQGGDDEAAYDRLLEKVLDGGSARAKKKSFNNNLVIQKVVDGLVVEPDAATLRAWIKGRYSVPLEGVREDRPEQTAEGAKEGA